MCDWFNSTYRNSLIERVEIYELRMHEHLEHHDIEIYFSTLNIELLSKTSCDVISTDQSMYSTVIIIWKIREI